MRQAFVGCTPLAVIVWIVLGPSAWAQQVHVATPLIGVNDSFYEHFNVGLRGMQRNGPRGSWFLNFGTPNSVIPPFGGYDPNADLRFGIGRGGFGLNFAASSGSNRSITMAAPSMTMMNGARGQFFSGSIRPFVTGVIPIVGDYPVFVPYVVYPPYPMASPPIYTSPLAGRLERLRQEAASRPSGVESSEPGDALILAGGDDVEKPAAVSVASGSSSAERGDISLAEIRRLQSMEDESKRRELEQLIEQARTAERDGQFAVARVRYQQAASRAHGEQRRELLEAFAKLKSQP